VQGSSPARLFHAIVLAGAAFGAASCQSEQLTSSQRDAAADRWTALQDAGPGPRDARGAGGAGGSGMVLGDASADRPVQVLGDGSADGPRDASCDLACSHPANSCQCLIIIL
jgi:hypothetical protein